jgi:uncharacterized membrane protein
MTHAAGIPAAVLAVPPLMLTQMLCVPTAIAAVLVLVSMPSGCRQKQLHPVTSLWTLLLLLVPALCLWLPALRRCAAASRRAWAKK